MAINIGDTVPVPSIIASLGKNYQSAMVSGTVQNFEYKKLRINLPNGELSQPICINLARKKICFLIVQIGDFVTEQNLLIPLRIS